MQKITFPDAPESKQSVQLDGTTYQIRLRWNFVAGAWSMDLLTRGGSLLVSGLRLVRGQLLLQQFTNDALPAGDFFVYDVASREGDYSDFIEGRAVLVYVESDDQL